MKEQTLILIKPDGVQRALTGEVLARFERAGLKIIGLKMVWIDEKFAKDHYREDDIAKRHGKVIWKQLLDFIIEQPVVATVLEGVEAVEVVRKMTGPTEPKSALPGTIRGDYAHHSYGLCDSKGFAIRNVIHASATAKEAKQEIDLWFEEREIHTYRRVDDYDHVGEK